MSQSTKRILKRMRTEIKYSALTTMTMWLLKANNLYVLSQTTAKLSQIKNQKNFAIIALRLAILFRELSQTFSLDNIVTYVFTYLRNNLEGVLRQKFRKFKNQNSDIFMDAAKGLNSKDIDTFQEICKTGFQKPTFVRQAVKGLYQRNQQGNYDREQLKSMQKLIHIFCTYGIKISDKMDLKSKNQNCDLSKQISTEIYNQQEKNNISKPQNQTQRKFQDTIAKKESDSCSLIIINETDFTMESIFENDFSYNFINQFNF